VSARSRRSLLEEGIVSVGEARYEVDGAVAVITVDASERRNALTPDLARELIDLFDHAASDELIGAILLRAVGPSFCSGADLDVVRAAIADPLVSPAFDGIGRIYELFRRIVASPLPTVAAVQGPAVGAGVNLALACDVRLLSEEARFIGFGRAGVHPGGGHLELLRAADRQAAAWLALCNQSIDATEAVRLGLGMVVVAPDVLDAEARRVATAAATDPDLARQVTASFRSIDGVVARHVAAVQIERAPQVWSLRRLGDDLRG
jgi:enoyl-CoA hydratase